jgi:hypothetical protein
MGENLFRVLTERYPFITLCLYAGTEYVGIVQNRDSNVTTIYDYGCIVNREHKKLFLDLGSTWWWESNHSIPINIFLREDWQPFRSYVRTFNNRDLEILHGPVCSLRDIAKRKTKRKSITLVRRVD